MNRLLIILFGISMIRCCNQPELLNNGLTKKVNKITEYTIQIKKDSLNNSIRDTVIITEKLYNTNDQIISRFQRNLFEDENMEIIYDYNDFKKIIKETVKLSNDSTNFIVDYFYKDSLLNKTKSESTTDIFRFKQIGEYHYNSEGILKESTSFQQYIDLETNDTISNSVEISKYNEKERVIKTITSDFIKPERNKKAEYDYNCGTLVKITEFNDKDSLISNTEYKYKFDKFQNWIERQTIKKGKLNYLKTREIIYK